MNATDPCILVDNEKDLENTLKAKQGVIALFYASWCPFCKKFLPTFLKNAEGGGRNFLRVQDDRETIADRYSIKIYPTVLYFEEGAVSKRLDGVAGVGLHESNLIEFIRSCPLPESSSET